MRMIEIHKVRKEKLNLIFFKNGDAISSEIISPSQFGFKNTDELIGAIKERIKSEKIKYQIYR